MYVPLKLTKPETTRDAFLQGFISFYFILFFITVYLTINQLSNKVTQLIPPNCEKTANHFVIFWYVVNKLVLLCCICLVLRSLRVNWRKWTSNDWKISLRILKCQAVALGGVGGVDFFHALIIFRRILCIFLLDKKIHSEKLRL